MTPPLLDVIKGYAQEVEGPGKSRDTPSSFTGHSGAGTCIYTSVCAHILYMYCNYMYTLIYTHVLKYMYIIFMSMYMYIL